jgi:hypothetical protein
MTSLHVAASLPSGMAVSPPRRQLNVQWLAPCWTATTTLFPSCPVAHSKLVVVGRDAPEVPQAACRQLWLDK